MDRIISYRSNNFIKHNYTIYTYHVTMLDAVGNDTKGHGNYKTQSYKQSNQQNKVMWSI